MNSRGIDSVPHRDTGFLSLPNRPDRLCGPPRVRRPERKADYSPPTISEVRKERSYTSTPPYAYIACTVPVTVGSMRGYRSTAGKLISVSLFLIIFSVVFRRKVCF
jgi:hypothetical protein